MAGYMPDDLFDAGAFAIAALHLKSGQSLEYAALDVYRRYESSYKDDDLHAQWLSAANSALSMTSKYFLHDSPQELADILNMLFELVSEYSPNGDRRKKRFFGGTRFSKRKSPSRMRVGVFEQNFDRYLDCFRKGRIPLAEGIRLRKKSASSPELERALDRAYRDMEQGNFAGALRDLLALTTDGHESWSLHYLLGQCYRFREDYGQARIWLEKARQGNPNDYGVLLGLGIIYQLLERYDDAVIELTRAIQVSPANTASYNSLGLTLKLQGKHEAALEAYQQAAEKTVEAAYNAIRDSHTSEAEVDGKRTMMMGDGFEDGMLAALRSTPLYATIQNNIGTCLAEMGRVEEARDRFIESIQTTPPGYDYRAPHEGLENLGFRE